MAEWTRLLPYVLEGVEETGEELGRGSYAVVYSVKYKGLPCVAKKLHEELYRHGIGYAARRFQEECALLSELRHPNVVQFIGVYRQPDCRGTLPVLVMEYLPATLAQCLDKYDVLPNELNYSLLKDIALALSYLHLHKPPVVHRDLSANNVLLTRGMTAKISDLGMAKILDVAKTQTTTPGTLCYMPPEALEPNPHYDSKVDVFSFGVLMVHLFSGKWPFPTKAVKVDPRNANHMIPQSEAERRKEYLDAIGKDHPLWNLMTGCLHNSPKHRPETSKTLKDVSETASLFPASSENNVELLQLVTSLRSDIADITCANKSRDEVIEWLSASIEKAEVSKMKRQEETMSLLTESKQHLASVQAELMETKQAMKKSYNNQQEAKKSHLAEVEQLQSSFRDAKQSLSSRVEALEVEVKAREQTIASLNEVVTENEKLSNALQQSYKKQQDAEKYHLAEVEQLHLSFRDNRKSLSSRIEELEAELKVGKQEIASLSDVLSENDKLLSDLDRQMLEKDEQLAEKELELNQKSAQNNQQLISKDRELIEKEERLVSKARELLEKEKQLMEMAEKLVAKDQAIAESRLKFEHTSQFQEAKLKEAKAEVASKDNMLSSIQAILSTKESLIASKDATIHDLQEQLDGLMKYNYSQTHQAKNTAGDVVKDFEASTSTCNGDTTLSAQSALIESVKETQAIALKLYPHGTALNWKECADIPIGMYLPASTYQTQTVVKGGKVYFCEGGGLFVYKYSAMADKWSTLPPAPVSWFGMGTLGGQLVIVGGETVHNEVTGDVYTLDKSGIKWDKTTIPPMPVSCHSPAVFSQQSCLTVIGGRDKEDVVLSDVNVFLPGSTHWCKVPPAPCPLSGLTSTVINGSFFVGDSQSKRVLQLQVSVISPQTTTKTTSTTTKPVNGSGKVNEPEVTTKWWFVSHLPHSGCALGGLAGSLIAIGGLGVGTGISANNSSSSARGDDDYKSLCAFSPSSKTWERAGMHILPEPLCDCITAPLSANELLVMGGRVPLVDSSSSSAMCCDACIKVYKASLLSK